MAIAKPNLTRIWAADAAGSDVVDPDVQTPGKFSLGWGAEKPPYQFFNFMQKLFTQGLGYFDEQGIGFWDTDTDYQNLSLTKGSNGVIYLLKTSGDGTQNPVSDGGTNWTQLPTREEVDAKASLQAAGILVTVGTGGDYPTINAALEYLSKLQPVYASAGITATINLLTGFTMAEQVLVRGLDMGWVTITGADAETTITNTALTTNFTAADYGFSSYPAFGVSKGGVLPRIDQLFRFDVANVGGEKRGIMAVGAGSSADVLAGAGVNDAGTDGIYADNGSTINAKGADASGAGSYGINASSGSTINAGGATGTLSQAINTVTNNGIIFQ